MHTHQHSPATFSMTADRHLYRSAPSPYPSPKPTHVSLCSCEPGLHCGEGETMVRSQLSGGVLTPLYSRMQNGWCCH